MLGQSPLVGEGGEIERSEMKPGEGFLSAAKDPSSGADKVRATPTRGEGKKRLY
jgi:hypothetical protein